MKNSVFDAFWFGVIKGSGCGCFTIILLLALTFFTIGLNTPVVNAYTLAFCVLGAIAGAVLGGIFSAISCAINNTQLGRPPKEDDEPPIAKP